MRGRLKAVDDPEVANPLARGLGQRPLPPQPFSGSVRPRRSVNPKVARAPGPPRSRSSSVAGRLLLSAPAAGADGRGFDGAGGDSR